MRNRQEVQPAPEGFDLQVTHRDPVTGLVTHKNPYTLRIIAEGSSKRQVFERPVGSGNLWDKKGQPAGRWVDGNWDMKAEHKVFIAPLTADQKLAKEVLAKDARIEALEKEIASIKGDAAKKSAPAQKTKES